MLIERENVGEKQRARVVGQYRVARAEVMKQVAEKMRIPLTVATVNDAEAVVRLPFKLSDGYVGVAIAIPQGGLSAFWQKVDRISPAQSSDLKKK